MFILHRCLEYFDNSYCAIYILVDMTIPFLLGCDSLCSCFKFSFFTRKKWFALWMFCKWNNKCICIKRSEICVFVLFDKKNNLVLQKKENVHVWVNRFVVFTLRTVRLKVCLLRGQDVVFLFKITKASLRVVWRT